jgi:AcrR family transcriptional regulator
MTAIGKNRAASRPKPTHDKPRAAQAAAKPPTKRARKRLDKRDRIRAAALELFLSKGYEATTTKAIAERAGIAAGTLFLYADDKQDLLFLVLHDRLQRVTNTRLGSLPSAPLHDQLMYVFRGLFEMYGEFPEIAAAFVRAFPGARGKNAQELNALTFAFLHRIAALIGEAQHRGEIDRRVEPLMAAQNIFALYFGALLAWINHMASLETALDPLLATSLKLQFQGLLPRP